MLIVLSLFLNRIWLIFKLFLIHKFHNYNIILHYFIFFKKKKGNVNNKKACEFFYQNKFFLGVIILNFVELKFMK